MKLAKLIFFILSLQICSYAKAQVLYPCKEQTCNQIFDMYKKYTRHGFADAAAGLGEMYYHGFGTDVDLALAIKHFRKGAKYGSMTAPYKLGYIYLTNPELNNYEKAEMHLKVAARRNHEEAAYLLGVIYSQPKYAIADPELADYWLNRAFDLKNPKAGSYISTLINQANFDANSYPKLAKLVDKYGTIQDEGNISFTWPTEYQNVVTQPIQHTLNEILTYELGRYTTESPEKHNISTGSRLNRNDCKDKGDCMMDDKNDALRLVGIMPFDDSFSQ